MRELERNRYDTSERPSIAVIGAGRLGSALARQLGTAGYEVAGPAGRDEATRAAAGCSVIVLAVPDGEIAAACEGLVEAGAAGPGRLVGHTSGATALDALAAAEREGAEVFSIHPLMTVTADQPELAGAGCAIAARGSAGLSLAERLARDLGMEPFAIPEDARAAYHAAASIASNFFVTLQAAAERLAAVAGLEPAEARELLAPLVRRTLENWAAHGPKEALTGPIARGDVATVAAHERAIAEHAPELLALYRALAELTQDLAGAEPKVPA